MPKKKLPRKTPKLDWKAIWAEHDEWWLTDGGGESWTAQKRAIQRIANKHVLKLLKETHG